MSKLLFADRITPCPHYASVILGSEDKAMFLQQLYYWLTEDSYATKTIKGIRWVKCSLTRWLDNFRWWSRDKLKRVIKSLETEGYIFSQEYNAKSWDRTKIYTLNYDKIAELQEIIDQKRELDDMKFSTPKGKNHSPIGAKCTDAEVQNQPLSIKSKDKEYLKTAEANASAFLDKEDIKEKTIGEKISKDSLLEKITLSANKKKVAKVNKSKDFEKSFVRIDLWNSLLLEYGYKDIAVNIGSKASGQLKNLYGYCQKAKIDFGEFLTFCVKNWLDVSYYIATETKTVYKRSPCPETGYLVQFFDHAYTYLARSKEKALESIVEPSTVVVEKQEIKEEVKPVLFHTIKADRANYGKAIDLEPELICHFGNHAHKHEIKRYNGWWYLGDKRISVDLVDTVIALKSGKYSNPMTKLRLYDTAHITFDYDFYLLEDWKGLRDSLQVELDKTN